MNTSNYSFYLFVQLRMLYAPSELPYDLSYEEDIREFKNYLKSEFNKDSEPEYECMEAYLKHKFKPHHKTIYKFARKCDVTGEGMNAGYCIGDGDMYIKHENDLLEYLRQNQGHDDSWTDEQTLEHFYEEGHYYFTIWEVDEDDSWFESNHADGRDAVEVQF